MTVKSRYSRYNKLQAAWFNGMPAYAVELGKLYLKDYPKDGAAWLIYGRVLTQCERYVEARLALRRAIRYCSEQNLKYPYSRMGQMYDQKGELKRAADWFRKCVELDPENATYRIFLGSVLARQGQRQEAAECFRKATRCKDGAIDEAYYNLGAMLVTQERYEEAERCFENAIKIDPKYKIARDAIKDIKKVMELKRDG